VPKLGTLLQIGRTFGMRDGLLRLDYETRRATGFLSHRMQSVQGWESWSLKNVAPKTSPEDLLTVRRQGGRPFFFADSRDLKIELEKILGPNGAASPISEAVRILKGYLPFFGRLTLPTGFPPRWFANPQTGQHVSPERPWTTMRFASADYGDLKFILEPSRFLFVYPLARAYALTSDEQFPEVFWQAVENWAASNPPMSGPLWICGQESSLRILAWSFALHAFLHSPATTPQRVATLVSLIAAHAWRTEQTLGYARSQRSNHLFSEAVGLWTVGTLYPELSRAAGWQKKGAHLLQEAIRDQITPEGAYLQDSFNYQRMVLHQLLWTLRLAEINKIELDSEIHRRTSAAVQFITEFVDQQSGLVPNHGSNDGSHILPLTACKYGDFRPLLALAASVLHMPKILKPGPWDEAASWLCPKPARVSSARPDYALPKPEKSGATSAAGYHRIGSANSWAFIRAGRYTRRPFQADQLHVDLWWHGLNIARDPGTYLYNGEPPWNNGLAGTAVHNTVMVDGKDQMRRAGRFLWLDWAQASGTSLAVEGSNHLNQFQGEHDGYRRLGVKHRRTVRCVTEDAWVIVDDLLIDNSAVDQPRKVEHGLRLHWLLPNLPFQQTQDKKGERVAAGLGPAQTKSDSSQFSITLSAETKNFHWHISSSSTGTADIIRSGKNLASSPAQKYPAQKYNDEALLGWESPTYGERIPAMSLLYNVRSPLPVRIVTVILAGEALRLEERSHHLVISQKATQLYKVSLSADSEPV
jgi:hypothetical protein